MSDLAVRDKIMDLQRAVQELPGAETRSSVNGSKTFPNRHHFANGVYLRQLFLPEGSITVGAIHRYECHNILMSGSITLVNVIDNKRVTYTAPTVWQSPGGSKRAVYANEDTVWITAHPVDKSYTADDLKKIEEELTVPDFEAFDRGLLK